MASSAERISRRREDSGTSRRREIFPPLIKELRDIAEVLLKKDTPPLTLGRITLGPDQREALAQKIKSSIDQGTVNLQIIKLGARVARGDQFDPVTRWLGGRLRKLNTGVNTGERKIFKKSELYQAASELRKKSLILGNTPPEWIPQPAPKEEILTGEALDQAMELVVLSERSDSAAHQLLDPIGLSGNGLVVLPKSTNQELNFTLPSTLFEILKTLKHPESERVFGQWIFQKCSSDEAIEGITTLEALVNFTSFLDSSTHLEIFRPPEVPGRENELLLQPFNTLLNSVRKTNIDLSRVDPKQAIIPDLKRIEDLIILRYAEVFSGQHRTSLYTVGLKALTPIPERFVELALSMVRFSSNGHRNHLETARALVNLAETVEVENIDPLIRSLDNQPELQRMVIAEAQRAGLISDPEAVGKVVEVLSREPWIDAGEVDFTQVVESETTDLEVYIFTGTFGPFTKGHKNLLLKLLSYLDSLPQKEGDKVFQRIVLVVPVTDVSNIPRYEKNAARMGPVDIRVSSILLQLAGSVDPKRVFITTALQPDPSRVRDLEGRVRDTWRKLVGKITDDLHQVGRVADFREKVIFAFGADEIRWHGTPRRMVAQKNEQREKVTAQGGVVVVRRGWLEPIIRCWQGIREQTGIETAILTPGSPESSSSVINEIAQSEKTQAIEAPAWEFVIQHWNPKAIEMRERAPEPVQIPSVGEIKRSLIAELIGQLR